MLGEARIQQRVEPPVVLLPLGQRVADDADVVSLTKFKFVRRDGVHRGRANEDQDERTDGSFHSLQLLFQCHSQAARNRIRRLITDHGFSSALHSAFLSRDHYLTKSFFWLFGE